MYLTMREGETDMIKRDLKLNRSLNVYPALAVGCVESGHESLLQGAYGGGRNRMYSSTFYIQDDNNL